MAETLHTPLIYLKGVGPERAALLQKELGVHTFEDLLHHFPFRYVDKTSIVSIRDLQDDSAYCQVAGTVERVELLGEGRSKRLQAVLRDTTGSIELVWFQKIQGIQKVVRPGMEFLAFGKPTSFNGRFSIVHPELELLNRAEEPSGKARLQPVYNTSEKMKSRGLDSKAVGRIMEALFEKAGSSIQEVFPEEMLSLYKLMPRPQAFRQMHFPDNMELQKGAESRLKFEELFLIQLRLLRQRTDRQEQVEGHVFNKVGYWFNTFYERFLPFELTGAQKRVIKEIREDARTGKQMNRLLQGDVGSGKTVVALMSMLLALDNGKQACMMAPTEILATQHFNSLHKLTRDMGLNVRLLTGSTKKSVRKEIAAELAAGQVHIIVGTHALLENWVDFPDLGLVVIDEQHRFGVAQRARLWKKNIIPPHILVMTATPIPRTLAMTLYGDLDTSVLDELPPGRKPIRTEHRFESARLKVFGFMKEQIAQGRQVYVVYPLIEESETLDYNNLMEGFAGIEREFPRPQYHISIVHGRMSAADKEYEMQRFKKGETQILVSTTVIEVGVDVPNASVMVIESAERFGLSQLHQLRGRVGRGASQSFCILMTGYKLSADAKVRMETMVRTNNGFELSEVDLRLRGPGDLAGTQQSGVLNLRLANLVTDQRILTAARHAAESIITEDPHLVQPKHQSLAAFLYRAQRDQPNWAMIS